MSETDETDYIRVPITLSEELVGWLENLSLKAKVTGGHKLPNTAIVRACLKAIMELDVNVDGVKDEEELKARILQSCAKAGEKHESKSIFGAIRSRIFKSG